MEIKPIMGKLKGFFKNYKYAIIVLVIGLALMLIPSGKKSASDITETTQSVSHTSDNIEEQLVSILKQIKGVGDVQVLLTLENSGETVFQTDDESSQHENNNDNKTQTVIITDADRNQSGLVKTCHTPKYRGAVVVCDGGDDPWVQFAITQAVMRSTSLKADQICVLKMK